MSNRRKMVQWRSSRCSAGATCAGGHPRRRCGAQLEDTPPAERSSSSDHDGADSDESTSLPSTQRVPPERVGVRNASATTANPIEARLIGPLEG